MERATPRKVPMYPGELCDTEISAIFRGAGDFVRRVLFSNGHTLYAYSIDGLVSSADISEYVFQPLTHELTGKDMVALFKEAVSGKVYNAVADSCGDLDSVAVKLVNGFCVVLFPGVGAVAYEVKTGEKRGLSAPEVENTV